jgi:hypothetical protein
VGHKVILLDMAPKKDITSSSDKDTPQNEFLHKYLAFGELVHESFRRRRNFAALLLRLLSDVVDSDENCEESQGARNSSHRLGATHNLLGIGERERSLSPRQRSARVLGDAASPNGRDSILALVGAVSKKALGENAAGLAVSGSANGVIAPSILLSGSEDFARAAGGVKITRFHGHHEMRRHFSFLLP